MNKDEFFFCYNMNLSKYLYEHGFRYILKAREMKTGNIFSLYKRNKELDSIIEQYKNK